MGNVLFYLATVFIWGSTWLGITFQLGVVDPQVSVAYRFILAAVLLLAYCALRGLHLRFGARAHRFILLQGLLLFGFNYWLIYLSTQYLTSGLIAVLFSSVIVMNIVNGRLWLGTPVQMHVVIGAGIGLVGIALVFWPELTGVALDDNTLIAIGLALLGTYSASLGNIVSVRNQRERLPVVQTNALGMAYGGFTMLVIAGLFGKEYLVDLSLPYMGSLLYLSVFGSIIAFGCYLTLVGRIGANKAAYAMLLFPVVALQLSVWFEGYQWSTQSLAGVALVLAGNGIILVTPKQWMRWLRLRTRSTVAQKPECQG
ncbi:MAG: EamA family transporter [Proteobacteria bacterium]|nr:MAG: EamA family transporter [Pseudomonadota bacterium]QKK11735.1 MAG: EamA family transporter [Pseudomonadota bacterium]